MDRFCIVQYDDRKKMGNLAHLMKVNEDKCKNDENCEYVRPPATMHTPPYWQKVFSMKDVLKTKDCTYAMYIDSDAVLNTSVRNLRPINKSILVTTDPRPDLHAMNAGVFIVKNDERGNAFLHDWTQIYENKVHAHWKKSITKKWHCVENNKACKWGGSMYEQGAVKPLLNKYKDDIVTVPWQEWNDYRCPEHSSAKVCHFMGNNKKNINSFLNG